MFEVFRQLYAEEVFGLLAMLENPMDPDDTSRVCVLISAVNQSRSIRGTGYGLLSLLKCSQDVFDVSS